MKALIAPILVAASFFTILFCSFAMAALLTAPYGPHHFKHMDASIWSDTPIRVDQMTQSYERLAATTSAASERETFATRDPAAMQDTDAAMPLPVLTDPIAADASACQLRYRSYRSEDNSYRPFSGGPRRQCEIDVRTAPVTTVPLATSSKTIADNSSSDHDMWCSSRYSSYNPTDDTYQPFGGGARRACASPVGADPNG